MIAPGFEFGPKGEGHLRVSFCFSMEQITEGMNRKVGLTDRMACGYRNFEIRRTMLFHQHGMLPEPPVYAGLSPVPDSA